MVVSECTCGFQCGTAKALEAHLARFPNDERHRSTSNSRPDDDAPKPTDSGVEEGLVGKGLVIVIAGAPCSGKGTQCQRLAEKFGFVHISTGDIFRDHVKRGTELGKQSQEYLNRNCFVPDEIVINLIRDRLKQPDAIQKGVLLDGFPRTADQASALTKQINVDQFIFLQVPDKALVKRALGRRIDSETGSIYHVDFLPPSSEVIPRLVCRESDKDEHAVRVRLNSHRESHRRILPYFLGKVERIDGMREPSEVLDGIVRTLKESQTSASRLSSNCLPQISNSCVICFDQPADFLVAPCGHQCGCEDCLKVVQETIGKCPICRSGVDSIQRVFKCIGDTDGNQFQKELSVLDAVHQDIDDRLDSTCVEDESWSEDESFDTSNSEDLPSLHIAPCDHFVPMYDHRGKLRARGSSYTKKIAPCDDSTMNAAFSQSSVMVKVQVPESQNRSPADICCLVDVSGSMGASAVESDGVVNKDGLSILDIAKHALKTVVHSLCDTDRLAVVAFDHESETVLQLTRMTKDGRDNAVSVLENLEPRGQTNIWGGLLAAMDALRVSDAEAAGRQKTILLLTDGQPNLCPPRGHLTELRNYKETHPEFSFQINTFGFGYNLNSELLLDLALEGHGTYAFIPDAVIVGTVFVNSVANVLSTLTQNANLHLCPQGKAEFTGPVLGDHAALDESWGRVVTLGPLQFGQSREVVVPLRIPAGSEPYLEVFLTYPSTNGERKVRAETSNRKASPDAKLAKFRNTLVSTGYDAVKQGCAGKIPVFALQKLLKDVQSKEIISALSADGRFAALKADLVDGRMSKSINGKERFNRWGKHYLRALMRSHQLQICTNFMDPGLQVYGGELFRALREKGDQTFLTLPEPKPSLGRASRTSTTQPDMSKYYAGAGGGCFGETSSVIVVTNDGMEVKTRVPDVRPGDRVRVADDGLAQVRCVVCFVRSPSKKLVAFPGGLTITPKHPVRIAGKWMLPGEMRQDEVNNPSGFVYNFVLDQCHILIVDGVECVTWGHGIEDGVVGHPYYGTDEVITDLSALTGWDQGFVMVHSCIRDSSGQVTRLRGKVMPATTLNNCAVTN